VDSCVCGTLARACALCCRAAVPAVVCVGWRVAAGPDSMHSPFANMQTTVLAVSALTGHFESFCGSRRGGLSGCACYHSRTRGRFAAGGPGASAAPPFAAGLALGRGEGSMRAACWDGVPLLWSVQGLHGVDSEGVTGLLGERQAFRFIPLLQTFLPGPGPGRRAPEHIALGRGAAAGGQCSQGCRGPTRSPVVWCCARGAAAPAWHLGPQCVAGACVRAAAFG